MWEALFHPCSPEALEVAWRQRVHLLPKGDVERVVGPDFTLVYSPPTVSQPTPTQPTPTQPTPTTTLMVLGDVAGSRALARETLLARARDLASAPGGETGGSNAFAMRFCTGVPTKVCVPTKSHPKGKSATPLSAKRLKTMAAAESKRDDGFLKRLERAQEKRRRFLERMRAKVLEGKGDFAKCASCASRFPKRFVALKEGGVLPACPLCGVPCLSATDKDRLGRLDADVVRCETEWGARPASRVSWLVVAL